MPGSQTIVITIPSQNGQGLVTPSQMSKDFPAILPNNFVQLLKDEPNEEHMECKPPRKRQRLDHLSIEEKLMRRKLKNRVAAQTARDRKKARMDEMEAELSAMENRMGALTELNTMLQAQNDILLQQNQELQARLAGCTCKAQLDSSVQGQVGEGVATPVSGATVRSAEGSGNGGSCQGPHSFISLVPVDVGSSNGGSNINSGSHGSLGSSSSCNNSTVFTSQGQCTQLSTSQKESSCPSLVGGSSEVVESSKEVILDHDYVGTHYDEGLGTLDFVDVEQDFLELASVAPQITQMSPEGVTIKLEDHVERNKIPGRLQDCMDLELKDWSCTSQAVPQVMPNSPARSSSPITKEEILFFLQDSDKLTTGPRSVSGSESGYESIPSPTMASSPTPSSKSNESEFDIDSCFNELFPDLFMC